MPTVCDNFTPVVLPNVAKTAYGELDLSVTNKSLHKLYLSDPLVQQEYINQIADKKNAVVLYGGYLEKRNLYKHSSYFNTNIQQNDRNVHLGVDFWCPTGSPVVAPLNGKIHSFNNNTNEGDYGPTIILEHTVGNTVFYTLYGHLSLKSIANIEIGETILKGQVFAYLGDSSINGGYAPHLHFQVINDLENFKGDYPGVCSEVNLTHYKKNCMNPLVFLAFD